MDDANLLQQIRDKILGVTTNISSDLDNAVYLQQIRDAVLGITGENHKYGNLEDALYLQQIRDAILGVTIDNSKYGSLDTAIYLQQIRDAYNGIAARVGGGMDDDIYLAEILAVAGPAQEYFERIEALNPIAYWPLWDASGLTATDLMGLGNGTYTAGVTLGQTGIGDGRTAALFGGSSHRVNIYSAALNGAVNRAEGTVSLWATVDAAAWTDGVIRTMFQVRSDVSNRIQINKSSTNNTLQALYIAGGTTESLGYTPGALLTYMHICLTWSKSGEVVKLYLNGSQVATSVNLGTWAAPGTLDAARQLISGQSTSDTTNTHKGKIAHVAIWNRALTPTEVASISSPFDRNSALSYLLTIGDSKTGGTGDDAGVTPPGYQAPLCRLLHDAVGAHFSEQPPRIGVGGLDMTALEARTAADIAGMTTVPTEILINMGANDVGGGFNKANWKASYTNVVNAYHTAFPGANIRLAKIWVRNTGTQAAAIVLQNQAIDEMYAAMTWLKTGINEALFLEGGDNGVTHTTDGTHPNHAGYALEAAAWKTAITGI